KTYNTGYSLMVTHLTTNPAVSGLFRGEQTGSQVLHYLWSYVLGNGCSNTIKELTHASLDLR
ncbi:hypothetical protein M406DRAFT_244362, partial [Cryphonectria parasitica EP155]